VATYYYICDNCGSIADISGEPHPEEGVTWVCGDCDSEALWEFTDREKAANHARHIQDMRYAADIARLEQAKAELDGR
jgi:hypothetical protein